MNGLKGRISKWTQISSKKKRCQWSTWDWRMIDWGPRLRRWRKPAHTTRNRNLAFIQGCMKFPTTRYSSQPHFFFNLDFFPKISVPFPSSSLDILPNSLNIIGKMILLPFFHFIFFPTALIFPSPLRNLIPSPTDLMNSPPPRGEGE